MDWRAKKQVIKICSIKKKTRTYMYTRKSSDIVANKTSIERHENKRRAYASEIWYFNRLSSTTRLSVSFVRLNSPSVCNRLSTVFPLLYSLCRNGNSVWIKCARFSWLYGKELESVGVHCASDSVVSFSRANSRALCYIGLYKAWKPHHLSFFSLFWNLSAYFTVAV